MGKSLVAVGASICLLLTLSACTEDKDIAPKMNMTEQQTLRIAAAANLSDVLPKIIDG